MTPAPSGFLWSLQPSEALSWGCRSRRSRTFTCPGCLGQDPIVGSPMLDAGLQLRASVSLELGQSPVVGVAGEGDGHLSSPAQLRRLKHQEAAAGKQDLVGYPKLRVFPDTRLFQIVHFLLPEDLE